jgi:regulator of protease activity HflC (stomatin/prohibitin superfamily)
MISSAILMISAIVFLVIAVNTCFTVEQQSASIVERFGRFVRIAMPGLNFKIPLIDKIRGSVNLRVQQLNVQVETKSEDNVFVKVDVAVQYHVIEEKIYEAFYRLENPRDQITAYVFDVVRARVPKMKLDDVFEKKDEIAIAVKQELDEVISNLGFRIVKSLVTDIDPDAKVKTAMNEINEAQRLRIAANERGEAEKILRVKKAEAEAESAALQGQGMANQRRAIIDGLRNSVAEFKDKIEGVSALEIMNIVLTTQYFDTLKEVGANDKSHTILIPHTPTAVSDLTEQMRNAMLTASLLEKSTTD